MRVAVPAGKGERQAGRARSPGCAASGAALTPAALLPLRGVLSTQRSPTRGVSRPGEASARVVSAGEACWGPETAGPVACAPLSLHSNECLVSSSGNDNTENGLAGSKADQKSVPKA